VIGASIAVIIALLIRTFFFQPFSVPGESMSPTINRGDYFFAAKFSERDRSPQRGDVIVFWDMSRGTYFVKRVAGISGDRVQMKRGRLFLNGVAIPTRRIEDYLENCGDSNCRIARYAETFPGGATDQILDRIPDGALDNTGVFVVPKNAYFVLGDNRDNSDDSRAEIGFVKRDAVVGRAVFKFKEQGRWTVRPVH
jgi:signal peptidase I